jgi:hypothetical protein
LGAVQTKVSLLTFQGYKSPSVPYAPARKKYARIKELAENQELDAYKSIFPKTPEGGF